VACEAVGFLGGCGGGGENRKLGAEE